MKQTLTDYILESEELPYFFIFAGDDFTNIANKHRTRKMQKEELKQERQKALLKYLMTASSVNK